MSDDEIKRIPIKELRQEEGASELASSPDMEPHAMQFCMFLKALVGAEEMKRMMLQAILLAQKHE